MFDPFMTTNYEDCLPRHEDISVYESIDTVDGTKVYSSVAWESYSGSQVIAQTFNTSKEHHRFTKAIHYALLLCL